VDKLALTFQQRASALTLASSVRSAPIPVYALPFAPKKRAASMLAAHELLRQFAELLFSDLNLDKTS
jgi:hypothetical protein